jgi:hypothetical protein
MVRNQDLNWNKEGPQDLLDLWAGREGTSKEEARGLVDTYVKRVVHATSELVAEKLKLRTSDGHLDVQKARSYFKFQHNVFKNYPCPHAMCIVDSEIIYLGLYEWEHPRGTQNPALRLSQDATLNEGLWTKVFLSEADKIDKDFSTEVIQGVVTT